MWLQIFSTYLSVASLIILTNSVFQRAEVFNLDKVQFIIV